MGLPWNVVTLTFAILLIYLYADSIYTLIEVYLRRKPIFMDKVYNMGTGFLVVHPSAIIQKNCDSCEMNKREHSLPLGIHYIYIFMKACNRSLFVLIYSPLQGKSVHFFKTSSFDPWMIDHQYIKYIFHIIF